MGKVTYVLVAHPDQDLRALLMWIIERVGHRVAGVADGDEALRELETGHYDLAVLDDDLPGVAEGGIVQTLRERGSPGPPVLMVCSVASPLDPGGDRQGAADLYLPTPFTSIQFLAAVASLLEGDADCGMQDSSEG